MKLVIGYVLAVFVAYVFGATFVSQGNIASVVAMGFEITTSHRIDAIVHDVANMYDIYLPVIAVAMIIALPVAALIIRQVPNFRLIGYVSAGFVAMITIHLTLKALLGMTGIAPTREVMGLVLQGVAGGLGGLAYHYVTLKPKEG